MGGISMVDDWELPALSSKARTLVLFGRTGNGKGATGNSILGRKGFESKLSFSGVTTTSELQSTKLEDGQVLNVIDTPGAAMKLHDQEEHVKSLKECTEKEKEMIYLKEMRESYKEQKKWITQMVELKLRETTQRLEQQFAKEQVARVKAEKKAQKAQKKSSDEILELRQSLEKARKETEEFRSKATSGGCAIL